MKRNSIFYACPTDNLEITGGKQFVNVPVLRIDDDSKNALRNRMTGK